MVRPGYVTFTSQRVTSQAAAVAKMAHVFDMVIQLCSRKPQVVDTNSINRLRDFSGCKLRRAIAMATTTSVKTVKKVW